MVAEYHKGKIIVFKGRRRAKRLGAGILDQMLHFQKVVRYEDWKIEWLDLGKLIWPNMAEWDAHKEYYGNHG